MPPEAKLRMRNLGKYVAPHLLGLPVADSLPAPYKRCM